MWGGLLQDTFSPMGDMLHLLRSFSFKEKRLLHAKIRQLPGGFVPWTTTRALPWTHWGLQDRPQDFLPFTAPRGEIPGSAIAHGSNKTVGVFTCVV
jgi:hypothetical protein